MTREILKDLLPIMQAFVDGKRIEYSCDGEDWIETETPTWDTDFVYRIKPEPKYRPFKTQEECWNEMLKHRPFGWLKSIKKQEKVHIGRVFDVKDLLFFTLSINEGINNNSRYFFNEYTFEDGTPFGIKEE